MFFANSSGNSRSCWRCEPCWWFIGCCSGATSCPVLVWLPSGSGQRRASSSAQLPLPVLPPRAGRFSGRNNSERGQLGLLPLPDTSRFETGHRHLNKQGCPPPCADHLPLRVAGTIDLLVDGWEMGSQALSHAGPHAADKKVPRGAPWLVSKCVLEMLASYPRELIIAPHAPFRRSWGEWGGGEAEPKAFSSYSC